MTTINYPSSKKKQDGIALLILVITLALTISVYYFSSISLAEIQADKLQQTRVALKQAKQLLLGHAATRTDLKNPMVTSAQLGRYGYLPCPAYFNGDGNSADPCVNKNENTLGWFPWRSLKTSPLKDGNGECLLYAMSGAYKSSPETDMLNEDTNGMFQIVDEKGFLQQGNAAQDRVVAIIFSAGDPLTGQNRVYQDGTECGNKDDDIDADDYSDYLDALEVSPGDVVDNGALPTGNADEVYRFVQAATATNKAIINDQFITISREELWSVITARPDFKVKMSNLTEALAECLRKYAVANGKNRLPWPAPMALADYRLEDNYSDNPDATLGHAGRFPFVVDDSNVLNGGVDDELFKAADCDNLVLPTTALTVHLLGVAPGADDEYINLWKNWKDHFFYVVSQGYAPDVAAVSTPCPGNCIEVDATRRAAAVIFAGSRLEGIQVRDGPVAAGDINTKNNISNYIDDANNQAAFNAGTGMGTYVTSGDDIMFCIEEGLGVVPC